MCVRYKQLHKSKCVCVCVCVCVCLRRIERREPLCVRDLGDEHEGLCKDLLVQC